MKTLALNTLLLGASTALVILTRQQWTLGALLVPFAAFAVIATWLCTPVPPQSRNPLALTTLSATAFAATFVARNHSYPFQLSAVLLTVLQATALIVALRAFTPSEDELVAQ